MEEMSTKTVYEPMGERIWDARIDKHYSRQQLADLADISDRFLYDIETGQKGFTIDVLFKLCRALDVTSAWVLYGNDQN